MLTYLIWYNQRTECLVACIRNSLTGFIFARLLVGCTPVVWVIFLWGVWFIWHTIVMWHLHCEIFI